MDYNTKAEEMVTISADGEDVFVCDFTVDSVEKAETIASMLRAAIADALRAAADEAQLETKRKCAMELRNFFGASSAGASILASSIAARLVTVEDDSRAYDGVRYQGWGICIAGRHVDRRYTSLPEAMTSGTAWREAIVRALVGDES